MPYKAASFRIFTFLVDDDGDLNSRIIDLAKELGIHNLFFYDCPRKFLNDLTNDISVCVIDHKLPGMTGLEVLKAVKAKNKYSFVIVMSGQESLHVALEYVNAEPSGVDKYLYKDLKCEYINRLMDYLKQGLIIAQERIEYQKHQELQAYEMLNILEK